MGYPSIHDLDEQSTLRCFCGIQFGACWRCISGHDLWFLFYFLEGGCTAQRRPWEGGVLYKDDALRNYACALERRVVFEKLA